MNSTCSVTGEDECELCRQVAEEEKNLREVQPVGATDMLEIVAQEPVSVQVDTL